VRPKGELIIGKDIRVVLVGAVVVLNSEIVFLMVGITMSNLSASKSA